MHNLKGKLALVTGGSSGIGLVIAETLGSAGAKIVLISRNKDKLINAQQYLSNKNIECHTFVFDASNISNIDHLITQIIKECGDIDILVNNVGATDTANDQFETITTDTWNTLINVNLASAVFFTQAVAKQSMMRRKQGKIINLSSMVGINPIKQGGVAYQLAKASIEHFTKLTAIELGMYNITVNCIAPGIIPSNMTKDLIAASVQGKIVLPNNALGKPLGKPSDISGISLLFASDASAHITGQSISVDGGRNISISL